MDCREYTAYLLSDSFKSFIQMTKWSQQSSRGREGSEGKELFTTYSTE